jgi:hypothetical protein
MSGAEMTKPEDAQLVIGRSVVIRAARIRATARLITFNVGHWSMELNMAFVVRFISNRLSKSHGVLFVCRAGDASVNLDPATGELTLSCFCKQLRDDCAGCSKVLREEVRKVQETCQGRWVPCDARLGSTLSAYKWELAATSAGPARMRDLRGLP